MTLLESTIARRLLMYNPQKYNRLERLGTLMAFVEQQAELAKDAMNSLGPEANDDQRREVASEYLNPRTPEQEMEQQEPMED